MKKSILVGLIAIVVILNSCGDGKKCNENKKTTPPKALVMKCAEDAPDVLNPVIEAHTIDKGTYDNLIDAYTGDAKHLVFNRTYKDISLSIQNCTCDQELELKIDDKNLTFTITALPIQLQATSYHSVLLFKGLLDSMQRKYQINADYNNCSFDFIAGKDDTGKEIVTILVRHNDSIEGYFDISAPPPMIKLKNSNA